MSTPIPDEPASTGERVGSLRGADALGVGPGFWQVAGGLGIVAVAVFVVVSFVSANNDNARIARMKDHGIAVVVTVTDCIGNLGGSGSNAANYTCTGTYRAHDVVYREVIGALTTFSSPGTHIAAIADPSRPSTVELTSAVMSSTASTGRFVVPGLLAVALIGLLGAYARLLARRRVPQSSP